VADGDSPNLRGGLGFGLKWNMGWMHDTLAYFSRDPVHRKYHQDQVTFSIWYAFSENYVLPLSHDETVHGKGSLIAKMPGDDWQKAANLRLLFGYQFTHPGKKLLFMGDDSVSGVSGTMTPVSTGTSLPPLTTPGSRPTSGMLTGYTNQRGHCTGMIADQRASNGLTFMTRRLVSFPTCEGEGRVTGLYLSSAT